MGMEPIPDYGLANAEVPEKLANALQLGPGFPDVVTSAHDSYDAWTHLKAEVRLNESVLNTADVHTTLATCFVNTMRNDLLELFAQGDTESEDELLKVMDGLRKRTEWPSAFVISQRVEVKAERVGQELCVVLGLYVTETDGSREAVSM